MITRTVFLLADSVQQLWYLCCCWELWLSLCWWCTASAVERREKPENKKRSEKRASSSPRFYCCLLFVFFFFFFFLFGVCLCETVYQFTVHRKTERTAQTAHRLLLLIFFFVFCFSELLPIRAKVAAVFAFAAAAVRRGVKWLWLREHTAVWMSEKRRDGERERR